MSSQQEIEQNLTEIKARLKQIWDAHAATQKQITEEETKYLQDTATRGNILRGWDSLLKGGAARKQIRDEERLFSASSVYSNRGVGAVAAQPPRQEVLQDVRKVPSFPKKKRKKEGYKVGSSSDDDFDV